MRSVFGIATFSVAAIALTGCRGVTWPHPEPNANPASLPLTERTVPAPDLSALKPDLPPLKTEPQGYYKLTAEDCRVLACKSSAIANLVVAGSPTYTHAGPNMSNRFASDTVRVMAAGYISAEARNRSAGAALSIYYRILELELKSDVLTSSIAELDALIKANDVMIAKGFRQTADSHELRKQRIDLDIERTKLRSALLKLNAELKNLLSIDPGSKGFLLPSDQVKVVPDPLDAEHAVRLAREIRADLNLLRAVGNAVDHRTVGAIRQVLIGVAPPLAAVLHRVEFALPDGLPFLSAVTKADVAVLRKQIFHLLIDREREVSKDVRTSIEEWLTARELVSIARKRYDLVQERTTELEKKAKVGQSVEIELRKSRLELLQAESDLIGEIIKWKLADVKAREVIGLLCDDCVK